MDLTLAVLLPLLQLLSLGTAAPLEAEDEVKLKMKMKSKVKWMAEQLLVRLDQNFQLPPGMPHSPTAMDIDGPASVVSILEGYNSLISSSITGVAQIKYDISSLAGYLESNSNCSVQRPKPPMPQVLQDLHSRKHFVETVTNQVVLNLKAFLNLLLKNLEQLTSC